VKEIVMNTLSDLWSVGRRRFLCLLPLTLVPASSLAQTAASDGCAPAKLTAEQFERLYKRLVGKWRAVDAKSTFLVGGPPKNPSSFIYSSAPNGAIRFTTENGPSVQMYDGRPYDGHPTLPETLIARVVSDEFTIDNIMTSKKTGKRTAHSTQIYAPDGNAMIYIGRSISNSGEEPPRLFQIFEKVPDSTTLWWETKR
jgi:hypothetical protein